MEAIHRCQEGDRDAFRFLVEQYGTVLHGTAYMMTRDKALTEDMVQESFLLAWRNISAFRAGTNLKAWLLRILVNRTISEQRKKSVPQTDWEDAAETFSDPDQVEDLALRNMERRKVRQALKELDPGPRSVVVLRYYAELTGPEIAEILGCREGTVRSRLHRAMAQLRPLLDEEGL